MTDEFQVLRASIFNIQVCAPKSWDKGRVRDETNRVNICGTANGWMFKEAHDQPEPDMDGDPVPNQCAQHQNRQHWILWA